MKHFETHFDDYITACDENNFYPKLEDVYNTFPSEIKDIQNIILYGRPGSGKYTQALKIISKYSPSTLKYEKKIRVTMQKNEYIIKISDVHFEIDMSLLGCNAKLLWHEWYNQIIDIVSSRSINSGIILCKNMQCINNDLLDIFYSYIQNNSINNMNIKFIFITESVCFLPENIINCCNIIGVGQITDAKIKKQIKKYTSKTPVKYDETITNIKSLYTPDIVIESVEDKIIHNIFSIIKKGISNIEFSQIRESIYELFIYEVNIHHCIWMVLSLLIDINMITTGNMGNIMFETQKFFKLFNNNYRPIYHVERYLYVIMLLINNSENEKSISCENIIVSPVNKISTPT